MEAQLSIRRRRRTVSLFSTRARVVEGLRSAAATIWGNEEAKLPASTRDYQAAVNDVEPLERKGAVRRMYPPVNKILIYFAKLESAWAELGFKVQARPHVTAGEVEEQIQRYYGQPRLSNSRRGSTQRITLATKRDRKIDPITGQFKPQGGVTVDRLSDLPAEGFCLICETTKPSAEMLVVHRKKRKNYLMRPHNKTMTDSYWKNDPDRKRKNRATMAARWSGKLHYPLLIQGRLRRALNLRISIAEAEKLYKRFGPCYPSRFGLTPEGRRAVERLRSTMRRNSKPYKCTQLRIVIYEQGLFIEPEKQPLPYQHAAKTLRDWHGRQKEIAKAA